MTGPYRDERDRIATLLDATGVRVARTPASVGPRSVIVELPEGGVSITACAAATTWAVRLVAGVGDIDWLLDTLDTVRAVLPRTDLRFDLLPWEGPDQDLPAYRFTFTTNVGA